MMQKHKNSKNIYIGRIIQEKVHERNMSYAEFARRVHTARTSLYRIFQCKSIDIERLLLISDVLNYDFIHEVYFCDEPDESTSLPTHHEEADRTDAELNQLVIPINEELKKQLRRILDADSNQ